MRSYLLFAALLTFFLSPVQNRLLAQDTFSMVAVDTVTGEVGAAGASCVSFSPLGGFINRLLPGRGALTTQAAVSTVNRDLALQLMQMGRSPQQILDSLYQNDSSNSPESRQNLVVDLFNGGARGAGFTGNQCTPYANQIVGPNYVIAGNILAGQQILDSMEVRFLAEPGGLASKLMAALQGANVPGADTRCGQYNTSSLAAFIRVAQPTDAVEQYTLDLNVAMNPLGTVTEPIDSLQVLFDQWLLTGTGNEAPAGGCRIYPQPASGSVWLEGGELNDLALYDATGREMKIAMEADGPGRIRIDLERWTAGIYFLRIGDRTSRLLVGESVR